MKPELLSLKAGESCEKDL